LVPKVSAPFDTLNLNYTLSVGANFADNYALELMLDHTEYSVQVDTLGTVSEYAVYTLMPLFRMRFPTASGKFVPYFLAGLGGTYGENNDVKPKGQNQHINAKGFSPGLMVGGGVEYFIARNLSFDFETRWRYSWGQEISIQNGPTVSGDTSEVQMTIGFRAYLLGIGKKSPY
jgi:opacity protein-like surface antigen